MSMSVFASKNKKDVTLGEGPEALVVTIKKLPPAKQDKAADVRQGQVAATVRNFGAEVMRAMLDSQAQPAAASPGAFEDEAARAMARKAKREARYALYDRQTVLEAGIDKWSVPEPVNPVTIGDLTKEVADWLHREILDYSLPPIDADEAEEVISKG